MKSARIRWRMPAAIFALFLCAAGTAAAQSLFNRHAQSYATVQGLDLGSATFRDGTYTGTANGFRPGLTVQVKVQNGKVTQIKVTEHSEVGSRFYDPPIRLIPSQILKEQSTSVDAVSGATATSYGIMAAVEAALKKATP